MLADSGGGLDESKAAGEGDPVDDSTPVDDGKISLGSTNLHELHTKAAKQARDAKRNPSPTKAVTKPRAGGSAQGQRANPSGSPVRAATASRTRSPPKAFVAKGARPPRARSAMPGGRASAGVESANDEPGSSANGDSLQWVGRPGTRGRGAKRQPRSLGGTGSSWEEMMPVLTVGNVAMQRAAQARARRRACAIPLSQSVLGRA